MKTEQEIKIRLTEIKGEFRHIDNLIALQLENVECYEVMDMIEGERSALMWVLEALKRDHADSFESLVQVLMMSEGISRSSALDVINIRNDNERCKLIDPEQPI